MKTNPLKRNKAGSFNLAKYYSLPWWLNCSQPSERGDSYTDGKTVTIGSKLDDKLFDPSVGLALHEGSHIKLSDFDFLRNLTMNIPKEYIERSNKKGFSENETISKKNDNQ